MLINQLADAEKLVKEQLLKDEKSVGMPIVIQQQDTVEYKDGWLFFYNTAEYLKTGNFSFALAGNGPLFVKRTGEIVALVTYRPVEESLRLLGIE